jgi:hypothetical protein
MPQSVFSAIKEICKQQSNCRIPVGVTAFDSMQVFWLAHHHFTLLPKHSFSVDMSKIPRLQRRARTGFKPVSLLAALCTALEEQIASCTEFSGQSRT